MYWPNKMIGESILELHETNATDESIKSYEYDEYQPITGTQLNNAGQITITIENQDQFLHLHNSYLLIEGNVLKADDTRYADADLIALTNNGHWLGRQWNMLNTLDRLHHSLVCRAINQHIPKDWHRYQQ